jgi:hypothetical protein
MKRWKIFLTGFLLLIIFSSGAMAGGFITTKTITAVYNGLKIYVNDKPLQSEIEPFIIENKGVTMVPIRAISEALGLNVYWDKATNSIFISNAEEAKPASNYYIPGYKYWDENKPAVKIENVKVLRNVGPFYEKQGKLMIAGRPFYSGIAVEVNEENKKAEVVLDLYKKFCTIEGYYGIEDETQNSSSECSINIYGDDVLLYQTGVLKPSMYPQLLPSGKIDLRNVNRLKIEVIWHGDKKAGDYQRIIAALANFKLYKK